MGEEEEEEEAEASYEEEAEAGEAEAEEEEEEEGDDEPYDVGDADGYEADARGAAAIAPTPAGAAVPAAAALPAGAAGASGARGGTCRPSWLPSRLLSAVDDEPDGRSASSADGRSPSSAAPTASHRRDEAGQGLKPTPSPSEG